jgi:L-malate glycosyltransferase
VHNGIQIDAFSSNNVIDELEKRETINIGMVARHVSWKNYNLFLDTASIVLCQNGNSDLRFLTVGGGPLRNESKEYAGTLGIKDKVTIGRETDDIPKFLRSIDIFVSSSNYEGLSNAIMEAMAAGLPCVVTDVGGNSELVVDGVTGYVVPPDDPNAMANRITHFLNNRHLAVEFGRAGKEIIRKEFNLERMIVKTEEIYGRLGNQ